MYQVVFSLVFLVSPSLGQQDTRTKAMKPGQCVIDTPSRLFTDFVYLGAKNSPDACKKACLNMKKTTLPDSTPGFAFAGVQAGQQCFCGQCNLTHEVFAPASECNYPCSGFPNELCGGNWRMNVYPTGITSGWFWRKVFSHNTAGGLFANLDEAKKKNIEDEGADLFSILYDLESMRNDDGVFHFKLCNPEQTQHDFPCNEWIQSSNPLTDSTITGYVGIHVTWTENGIGGPFQGLGLSQPSFSYNLIDDVPNHENWFNSIGALKYWGGSDTIPGPIYIAVTKKDLYVYTTGG